MAGRRRKKKLSRRAAQPLQQHGKRNELLVSSISFFEDRDARAPRTLALKPARDRLAGECAEAAGIRRHRRTRGVNSGDAFPGDPADRLIAATVLVRNAPLVRR